MSSPAKKKTGSDLLADLKPKVQSKVVEALQDPVAQEKLKEKGQQALVALKKWRTEKDSGDDEESDGPTLWVFHQRLVRRERRIRRTITDLTKNDIELKAALAPVVSALDDTVKALKMAQALPLKSRRKAHKAIDGVLDDVEDQLLAAGLGIAAGGRVNG